MASSVNLGAKLDEYVDRLVKDGRYGSRSEVLREGVRLVQEREAKWARFDAEIQKGIDDAEAGRTVPLDEAFDRVRERLKAKAAKRAA